MNAEYKRKFLEVLIGEDVGRLIEYKKFIERIMKYEELSKQRRFDFESNSFLKMIKDILDNNMTLREKEEIIETLAVDYEYKVFKNIIASGGALLRKAPPRCPEHPTPIITLL
jgi:UDP-N-acetylglucosamine pyrophosphorylase